MAAQAAGIVGRAVSLRLQDGVKDKGCHHMCKGVFYIRTGGPPFAPFRYVQISIPVIQLKHIRTPITNSSDPTYEFSRAAIQNTTGLGLNNTFIFSYFWKTEV